MTNFSSKIPCPGDMYKSGALCYRNCEIIGLFNCGIGACISDDRQCAAAIGKMVQDVIDGISTLVITIASGGTATAAKLLQKLL
jgi:hypothetical protein